MKIEVRESVRWFAEKMEEKLKKNDHKGGWDNCDIHWLIQRIKEETNELLDAVNSGTPKENIINEAADIGNFAMMVADIARKFN